MYELTDRELYKAIEYAKNIDEATGRSIIEKFQSDQPALAQTIFTLFPAMISAQNQDMAHLFMDFCFDIICIYQHAFGDMPAQNKEWLTKQAALMDEEIQALLKINKMDTKARTKLQDHYSHKSSSEVSQTGLLKFFNESIDAYAADIPNSTTAINTTQSMMVTVIRLFNKLYSQSTNQ